MPIIGLINMSWVEVLRASGYCISFLFVDPSGSFYTDASASLVPEWLIWVGLLYRLPISALISWTLADGLKRLPVLKDML